MNPSKPSVAATIMKIPVAATLRRSSGRPIPIEAPYPHAARAKTGIRQMRTIVILFGSVIYGGRSYQVSPLKVRSFGRESQRIGCSLPAAHFDRNERYACFGVISVLPCPE